ncbi:MAG: dihydrolipoyl dehydrogenase [Thermodesulfobacteriota bacterium]
MEKFNLTVIGSGPGGYIAAIRAAQLGMKVAIIERDKPGGVCLNWGCIPSKALLKCAEIYEKFKVAEDYGIKCSGLSFDYSKVIEKSRKGSATMTKGVEFLFKKNKITLFSGIGKLIGKNKIGVSGNKDEKEIEAEKILIATGSVPRSLPDLEIDGNLVMTSDEAIMSTDFPDSIVIIGGGYIGAEFAYVYNSFGSKVTIVEMEKHLLPGADGEVAQELEKTFRKAGMNILTSTKFKSLTKSKKSVEVTLEDTQRKEEKKVSASKLLVAIGRKAVANTAPTSLSYYGNGDGFGLKELNIELNEQGFIKTDDSYMTTCSDVYAIGDIIGPPLLAHKASEEGVVAVEIMAGLKSKVHYDNIPACVYCQPEIASVGFTEEQVRDRGYKYNVGKIPFRAVGKAVGTGETEGFVKLIADAKTGEILGAHIIGHGATELIAEIGVAKTLESTPLEIAITSHAHPTLSEGVMEAALATLGRARNF